MDPINIVKNNIRKKVAGSLKTNMPTKTVPTAPMPVQTAYAVPMGRVCVAFTKSIILIAKAIKKPIYHKYISLPVDSFALPKITVVYFNRENPTPDTTPPIPLF